MNRPDRQDQVPEVDAERILRLWSAELSSHEPARLEFSIRLKPGKVENAGRFTCWLDRPGERGTERISSVLHQLQASDLVITQVQAVPPEACVSHGLAVSASEDSLDLRYYRHARHADTLANDYQAWRWQAGQPDVHFRRYRYHFMPETPDGVRPLDLAPEPLRPALAKLLAEPRFMASSGFWVRETADGVADQLDLIFPWMPPAASLAGLDELADALEVPGGDWRRLCIRHLAIPVGESRPSLTLYAAARLEGDWPATEAELQEQVTRGAASLNRRMEAEVFERLPALPPVDATPPEPEGVDVGAFYDGEIALWRKALGPGLHYHAGFFPPGISEPTEDEMVEAQRKAVTELYPLLPTGKRIYDVGCGWGGPMAMWVRDLRCPTVGITASRDQYRYIASLGLEVRLGNAETTLPPGMFDCAVLLESFTHIREKERLLRVLRIYCNRLVMRVNCQDVGAPSANFGGSMFMISSATLRELVERAGWRIVHWQDRRAEALPSMAGWSRALRDVPPTRVPQIEVLRHWSTAVASYVEPWGRNNPLIELMAE